MVVSDKADPNPYTLRPADGDTDDTLRDVEVELSKRWPENKLEPSLDRIEALMDILGQPQRSFPSIHITGTNGKTSTARMIEQLLNTFELRTGRYTSPHVESVTERITLDGAPITPERFVEVYRDIEPYVQMVDAAQPVPMSFFEVLTGMAYAAFADAPVDVAVVEVGMGGSWDATNVIDAAVAVITPIGLDHTDKLGETTGEIAVEKSGIIKSGAVAVVAQQQLDAAQNILRRAVEVDATVAREGMEFGVIRRELGVGGQLVSCAGSAARSTRTSSSRCTASTRRTTRCWRWPRSRPSSASAAPAAGSSTWTRSARPSPVSPRPAAWRSSAAAPRSSWTPRTTRTAPAPPSPPSASPSASPGSSA